MPHIWNEGGGGGATTNIDAGARSLIAQLLGTPGTTADIQPNAGITVDGRQWQNQTLAAKPIPSPANATTMAVAGFTDVTQGGGTDSLNTAGPWTGAATAGDEFGLDPATGDRYFVDNAGDWQPVEDAKAAIEAITAQPSEIIPVGGLVVTPLGIFENATLADITLSADDPQTQASLELVGMTKFTAGDSGGAPYIPLTAVDVLVPDPNDMVLRIYGLIAETPITAEPDPVDNPLRAGVVYTVPASTSATQKFRGVRHSTAEVFLSGAINGGNGVWINSNTSGDAEFLLTSDGAGGWRASK